MRRDLFTEDHEAFRELARDFVEKEVVPHYPEWEKGGRMPRDVFKQMGALGMLGMAIPEEYGGAGIPDYRYNVVLQEEAARALVTLSTVRTQLEVILPYFLHYANAEQRQRWFPGLADGTLLTAVAMTEPGTGSDLAGVRTTAVRDGDDWIVNGAKTFITGGMQADLVIVVARTSTDPDNRRKGLTLLVVEDGMAGFTRGRELEKMGCKVQDTAELSFVDVRVPATNVLGEEGEAFSYLGHNLPQERLTIAVGSVAQARSAMAAAIDYTRSRKAFGTPVASVPEHQVRTRGVLDRSRRPGDAGPGAGVARRRRAQRGRCGVGEAVLHRDAAAGDRPLPAAFRRLRLHDGVSDRPAVYRRPGGQDLRRHQRGDEGDHREIARVCRRQPRSGPSGELPASQRLCGSRGDFGDNVAVRRARTPLPARRDWRDQWDG